VFTSALRSNLREADLIENSLSVENYFPSRCLATLCANTPQYFDYHSYYQHTRFSKEKISLAFSRKKSNFVVLCYLTAYLEPV
jgi:hypothetical protein